MLPSAVQKRLVAAIKKGSIAELEKALAAGADINFEDPEENWAALHRAAIAGKTEMVKAVLAHGANVKLFARGFSALHLAAKYGDAAMIQVLLEAGADLEGRQKNALGGDTPLGEALAAKNLPAADALITAGAKLTARDDVNRTLLHVAAGENLAKLIPKIAKKIDVNAVDINGHTALHNASYAGHLDAIKALLAVKAKRSLLGKGRESDHGGAPLHAAAEGGQPKAIALLIAAGDSVDMLSRRGETPLYFAIREGSLATVKTLLDAGANVNVNNTKGVTPLMQAVMEGAVDLAKLLIAKGADVNVKTKQRTMVTDRRGTMQTVEVGSTLHQIAALMKLPALVALFPRAHQV